MTRRNLFGQVSYNAHLVDPILDRPVLNDADLSSLINEAVDPELQDGDKVIVLRGGELVSIDPFETEGGALPGTAVLSASILEDESEQGRVIGTLLLPNYDGPITWDFFDARDGSAGHRVQIDGDELQIGPTTTRLSVDGPTLSISVRGYIPPGELGPDGVAIDHDFDLTVVNLEVPANAKDYFFEDGATFAWGAVVIPPPGIYIPETNRTVMLRESWDSGQSERFCRACQYDHTTENWSFDYTIAELLLHNDDHGIPALAHTDDGYFFAFFDGHSSASQVWATVNPDDISEWAETDNIGANSTYPHPHAVGSMLYNFVRGVPESQMLMFKSTSLSGGSVEWDVGTIVLDIEDPDIVYQGRDILVGTDIYKAFCIEDRTGASGRRHVYCLIYDTVEDNFRNIDGSAIVEIGDLPIDLVTLDADFRVVDQSSRYGCIPSICRTAFDGKIHFVYMDEEHWILGEDCTVKYVNWNGSVLSSPQDIGETFDPFQFPDLLPLADGSVEVYFTRNDDAPLVRGGSLYKRVRAVDGSLSAEELVLAQGLGKPLSVPFCLQNGHADAKVMVAEKADSSDDPPLSNGGSLKGYLLGDSGLIQRRLLTTRPALWLEFSDHDTTFTDAAGTTPALVDGDALGLINGKEWFGQQSITWPASQASAGAKPTLRNAGAIWHAQFNANDFLVTDLVPTSSFTMIAAFRAGANSIVMGCSDSFYCLLGVHSTGVLSGGWRDASPDTVKGATNIVDTDVVAMLRVDGASVELWLDDELEYSGTTAGLNPEIPIYLGARNNNGSAGSFVTGRGYAFFAIREALPDEDYASVAARLRAQAGI